MTKSSNRTSYDTESFESTHTGFGVYIFCKDKIQLWGIKRRVRKDGGGKMRKVFGC